MKNQLKTTEMDDKMKITENKPTILIVDDEERNLRLIEAMLAPQGYNVVMAHDGVEALQKTSDVSPDIILLDIMMPKMNGFEVAQKLKQGELTSIIPIVMITSLMEIDDRVKALEVGADDFLSKPVESTELRARVKSLLKVKAYNDHMQNYQKELETEVAQRTRELQLALETVKAASLDTIYRLSRAAEYKDEDTGAHTKRMSEYTVAIARKMNLSDGFVESLLYAAPMHDLGKIGIPDHILLKPDKLDSDEWEIMRQHTTIGAQILSGSDSDVLRLAEIIALTHHEKWDGSGYPKGIKGLEIPIAGRIVAVADVYDALTSNRPYRKPLSSEEASNIIREGRGNHFDPEAIDSFFAAMDKILPIKQAYENKVLATLP